jgi:hypothetical protein
MMPLAQRALVPHRNDHRRVVDDGMGAAARIGGSTAVARFTSPAQLACKNWTTAALKSVGFS